MFKKLLIALSGNPKPEEEKIMESLKIIPSLAGMFLSYLIIYIAIKTNSMATAIFAPMLAWQVGWGMSIYRFKESENDKNEQ